MVVIRSGRLSPSCPWVFNVSVCCTCRPATFPWRLTFPRRFANLYWRLRWMAAVSPSLCYHLGPGLPDGPPLCFLGFQSIPGPNKCQLGCWGRRDPLHFDWSAAQMASLHSAIGVRSVSNGSRLSLRVQVRVQTATLRILWFAWSTDLNHQLGYSSMVVSQHLWFGLVVRGSPSGFIWRFI